MTIVVEATGWLSHGGRRIRCAVGRSGICTARREGDGSTPAGTFRLRRVFFRPDRLPPPKTGLPIGPLRPDNGWCDAPNDPSYNRLVQLPHSSSAEALWRKDHLYDIIVVIGFNDDPPEPRLGSAIFLHLASQEYDPTEGCVAIARMDAIALIENLGPSTTIRINPALP